MSELTSAQQAVMNELHEKGQMDVSEVHPMTVKVLVGLGLIISDGGTLFLPEEVTASYAEESQEEVLVSQEEVEVNVAPEQSDDPMVENVVTLADKVSVDVGNNRLVTLPAGSEHPLLSYHEENTRRRVLKWFTCLHVPSGSTFIVNSIRNTSRVIEPRPLSSFK